MLQTVSITEIPTIGIQKAKVLSQELSISTIEDLFYFKPRKYIDKSNIKNIADCKIDEHVTVIGNISNISVKGFKKKYLEIIIQDSTGFLAGVFFGGIHYFKKIFNSGDMVVFSGTIQKYTHIQITHPEFDLISNEDSIEFVNTGRIIPLYKSNDALKKAGFNSRGFRKIIKHALDAYSTYINDTIDKKLLQQLELITLEKAITQLHYPDSKPDIEHARKRLAFNEIYFILLYSKISNLYIEKNSTKLHVSKDISKAPLDTLIESLQFTLTTDQSKAIEEIQNDIYSTVPMNRLLQGDVGSGKTIVAIAACLMAIAKNSQAAIMAPTEILAIQHFNTISAITANSYSVALLTGSTKTAERKELLQNLQDGSIQLIIGTHALIQNDIIFNNLGLIIIDEQHRFGANQRIALRKKGGDVDLLVMTATPIPRSLALTMYSDLKISVIKSRPNKDINIKTLHFPESKLKGIYNSMEKYINQGRQVYYVLPLIEESEKLDLDSAIKVFNLLNDDIFSHRTVALLHGKLKNDEKNIIMDEFNDGKIDILVSTTVIEVGIDVPNANVIIIHHAERFGLSQLHQLRGRVGRGNYNSFCILVYPDNISEDSLNRIEIVKNNSDGFYISEADLDLRGEGDYSGLMQHGKNVGFEFLSLKTDKDLIIRTKEIIEYLSKDKLSYESLIKLFKKKEFSRMQEGLRTKKILEILS